jgi:putative transcriptional regulator
MYTLHYVNYNGADGANLVRLDNRHTAVLPMKNRLRVLRAEFNWSQMELGLRVGVSRQAINAIETGKYDPSLPLALKIARIFDQPVEDIFELDETD